MSIAPLHVARVFPTCAGASEGESGASFLPFLQSFETSHSIDADSTVTCLVHGHVVESQSVGCSLEESRCDRVIETPDFPHQISTLQLGQELVDPLKPALVHEDRPLTHFCFGGYSNFGNCNHDHPETTRADFGTGHGSFSSLVSLSSSLPAGWPSTRALSRASTSRLLEFITLFTKNATVGVGHRIADLWQGLTLDGCLASGGRARNRATWTVFVDLHETLCVAGFCITPR